jgi:hypothetical protein
MLNGRGENIVTGAFPLAAALLLPSVEVVLTRFLSGVVKRPIGGDLGKTMKAAEFPSLGGRAPPAAAARSRFSLAL